MLSRIGFYSLRMLEFCEAVRPWCLESIDACGAVYLLRSGLHPTLAARGLRRCPFTMAMRLWGCWKLG